jgi:hypothetical protein
MMNETSGYTFRQWYIPERMMDGINLYVEHGIPPGDFLCAVITNDLSEACGRADDENIDNLPAYVAYFYNEAPSLCWGSVEKMQAWINNRRQAACQEGDIHG